MNGELKRIAILGSTGHIARSIISSFKDENKYILYLFTRSIIRTTTFIDELGLKNSYVNNYSQFNKFNYDIIINCVGIGNPAHLRSNPDDIFFITEEMDLMVLSYLRRNPETVLINFSSGAVYGTNFTSPVNDDSNSNNPINNLTQNDFYSISKINSEAKHRSLVNLNIIDLRIFSFYSKFIDTQRPFFISEVIESVKQNKTFYTSKSDIIRDYIHPLDLSDLIKICINLKTNFAFDVCSKKPVSKFEILEYFRLRYDLVYSIDESIAQAQEASNYRRIYYSESRKQDSLGFQAQYTSLDCIKLVTQEIFNNLIL